MAAPIRVVFVGDDAALQAAAKRSEAALAKFAGSAEDAARVAGKAAADQAKAAGASASEQEAAAARAAAAVVESSARMTEAQKAAAKGAIAFAKTQGAAADEQVAAAQRAIAAQKKLEDQQKAASDAAEAAAGKTAAASEASAARVVAAQKKLSSVGKWTLFGGAAGIAASVKGAADLSQSMERLQTQAGASTSQVAKLTQGVLSMAGKVGESPDQLAQGLYHVVSNLNKSIAPAQRVTDELDALKVASEGARVGGSDLVDTTNALGGAIRSGIAGTQNYQQAMGALNATVGAGDMSMQNLAEALGTGLLGPMKTYGVSLKDISSALAVFGDNNIKGANAGTKLNSAIRIMAAPSATAARGLAVLHMGVTQLADDIRTKGLPAAFQDLESHLKQFGGTASQQADMITRIFGGKQSTGVQILLNQLTALKESEKQVGDGANQFGSAWQHQQQQLSQEGADLSATVKALADRFGMDLIPILKDAGNDLGDMITWFEKNKGAAEALGATIATVLGVAVTVFVGEKIVAFVNGLRGIVSGAENLAGKLVGLGVKADATGGELSTMGGEAATAGGEIATMGGEADAATGQVSALGGAASAATGEVAGLESVSSGLLGSLTKLEALGTVGVTVAVAFEAFDQIKNIIKSGGDPLTYMSPDARNLIAGSGGLSGDRNPNSTANSIYTGGAHTHGISGSSPPWVQLGISKARYEKMTPTQKRSVTGTGLALPGVPNSATTAEPAQLVAFFQKALGLTKNQAAGIAGNLQVESAGTFAGNIVQGGARASTIAAGDAMGTGGGYGMAQWTDQGRQANLAALAKQMGLPQDSVKVQEAFIVQELKGSYASALANLKGTSTAAQAATVIQNEYEGPASLTTSLAERQQDAIALAGGAAVPVASRGASSAPSAAVNAYLTGTSSTAGTKPTMRYYNHQPVGMMTEAQWQAWQAQNGATKTSDAATTSITSTIDKTVSRYQGLEQSAPTSLIAGLYRGFVHQLQALAPKFEDEAKKATSSTGAANLRTALSDTLTAMEAGLAANVKNFSHAQSVGTSLITKFGNAGQSGTSRTLENALGFRASGQYTSFAGVAPGHGMSGVEGVRESDSAALRQLIEGLGRRASSRSINRTLLPAVTSMTSGSPQNQAYQSAVENLIKAGQTEEADKLVAAHKQAMQALAVTLYSDQETKDGKELDAQATALKDQTTAIQNAMQTAQQVWTTSEQKINDMAAAVVQSMQDVQQTTNDTMAGVAQAIKDAATVSTDQSTAVVDAINDQTQTQVDQIGEKGLYGLNLIAQQDKVAADQVKAYWDQQIDAAQKQLDIDQQQADAAENAAQIALDNVTATEHVAVQQAQATLDSVEIAQATKVAAAQAHADAVQQAADVTLIGPAQMAVDLNANASKSVQQKMAAQLTAAQGLGDEEVAGALKNLATVQSNSQTAIDAAQNAYDTANNTATQDIQGAQNTLANITNYWNNVIADAGSTLAGVQGNANKAEGTANSTYSIESARASTQFAGSGLTVQIYGADLSNSAGLAEAVEWGIRASGVATP